MSFKNFPRINAIALATAINAANNPAISHIECVLKCKRLIIANAPATIINEPANAMNIVDMAFRFFTKALLFAVAAPPFSPVAFSVAIQVRSKPIMANIENIHDAAFSVLVPK